MHLPVCPLTQLLLGVWKATVWLLKAFAAIDHITATGVDPTMAKLNGGLLVAPPKHPFKRVVFHASTKVHWQSRYWREKKNLGSIISRAQHRVLDTFLVTANNFREQLV